MFDTLGLLAGASCFVTSGLTAGLGSALYLSLSNTSLSLSLGLKSIEDTLFGHNGKYGGM